MFMKLSMKIKSKIEQNNLKSLKETEEERKERIKYASKLSTKIIPNKNKIHNRKQKYQNQFSGEVL